MNWIMNIAKQCVTGGRDRRNTAFLQPTASIPSTWNSLIPWAVSEAVISHRGLSSANSLEKGETLYLPQLLPCHLLLDSWLLLDLCAWGTQQWVSSNQQVWMFPCWLRAQGKVWADTAEEARRSSLLVSRESQNHRSNRIRDHRMKFSRLEKSLSQVLTC